MNPCGPGRAAVSRRRTWATGVGLFVGTLTLLLATLDMGFTRDESFYFRYAGDYQKWFVSIEQADTTPDEQAARERVFSRKGVLGAWSGNFEHPPLMKTAFGFSWRIFARKDRPVARFEQQGTGVRAQVSAASHNGFAVGAGVVLLAPRRIDQAPDHPDRILLNGVVADRRGRHAQVYFSDQRAKRLTTLCRARAGDMDAHSAPLMTGCEVREDRLLARMSESTALRLPGLVTGALAVVLTFLLGLELFGYFAGLFGALAFLFVPRHFFHAHLCCFDMPIVAATLAVLYAFWRARTDRRWALAAAVLWGVALLTKLNAFFLPVPLVMYWLWVGRDRIGLRLKLAGRFRPRLTLPSLPLAFLAMPVVGIPMLFVYWPKLWFDSMRAFRDYVGFHMHHAHYMQWYFGDPLQVPPFPVDLPFVMTAATVPLVFLALVLVGVLMAAPPSGWGTWLRGWGQRRPVTDNERRMVFALALGLFPIVLIALPSTPIFGGVKHWMTGMPLLLIVAGFGLQQALRGLRLPRPAWAVVLVLVLAQPVRASIEATPYGTGYYAPTLVGGVQGAADKQMMRMYWGHTTRQTFDWLNRVAPKNAKVFFQNTTRDAYVVYKRDGLLRGDIRYARTPSQAAIALIEPQKAFAKLDVEVRERMGVAGPVRTVAWRGVPYLYVYAREGVLPPKISR
ncbi:MAG: hypothetical protein ACI9MR_001347 [Myxococcota bacterium]